MTDTHDIRQAAYSRSRLEWMRLNELPGPLPGYGGKGPGKSDKLAMTNPKGEGSPS